MNNELHTIHDNPGHKLDCSCVVEISKDDETVGLCFPTLADERQMGPMVFVSIRGTELTVDIGSAEESEWELAYCEEDFRWRLSKSPLKAGAR